MSQPIIYLSNWSNPHTRGHHGPGRKLCGMVAPRDWEKGDGHVKMVAPDLEKLRAVQADSISIQGYLQAYDGQIKAAHNWLAPGSLRFSDWKSEAIGSVQHGDSILCACAIPDWSPMADLMKLRDAKRHPCHLEVLAPHLLLAGWAVRLYGRELIQRDGMIYREGRSDPYSWLPL